MNMKEESKSFGKVFLIMTGAIVTFGGMILYIIWANAFVGMYLWQWFVVPFDIKPLTMAHAWGLSILISLWTHQHYTCKCKDTRSTSEKTGEIIGIFLYPWMALLMGYIAHSLL